jgi:hypothetical protein
VRRLQLDPAISLARRREIERQKKSRSLVLEQVTAGLTGFPNQGRLDASHTPDYSLSGTPKSFGLDQPTLSLSLASLLVARVQRTEPGLGIWDGLVVNLKIAKSLGLNHAHDEGEEVME